MASSDGGHFEAERLGGLEVDHQFELGRLYDRKVGGLLAFENPAGVNTDQTVRIHKASSIADEAANRGGIAKLVDSRERHGVPPAPLFDFAGY